MQVITRAKDIRTSTRKVRLIADAVRSLGAYEALDALSVMDKKGARDLEKVLKSALSNAQNNFRIEKNNIAIKEIDINEGTSLKRFHPSTRGRIHPYKKRSTNIRIILEEKVVAPALPKETKEETITQPKAKKETKGTSKKEESK